MAGVVSDSIYGLYCGYTTEISTHPAAATTFMLMKSGVFHYSENSFSLNPLDEKGTIGLSTWMGEWELLNIEAGVTSFSFLGRMPCADPTNLRFDHCHKGKTDSFFYQCCGKGFIEGDQLRLKGVDTFYDLEGNMLTFDGGKSNIPVNYCFTKCSIRKAVEKLNASGILF